MGPKGAKGMSFFGSVQASLCLCLFFSSVSAQNPRKCSVSDIKAGFGQCDKETKARQVYYFFDSTVCSDDGSIQLPQPQTLSCTFNCEKGRYLDMNVTAGASGSLSTNPICVECNSGEFSLGGGYVVSGEFGDWKRERWPTGMKAWCIGRVGSHYIVGANRCKVWSSSDDGNSITSGDNRGNHNVMSALTLVIVLKKKGYVSFRYKVEGEAGKDGLEFTINSIIRLSKQSNQPTWRQLKFNLDPGSYVLEWFYWKNENNDYGKDRAELEIVEVVGTEYADLRCYNCPNGTSSTPGSGSCVYCGENQFASEEHYGQCIDCPEGTYSFPGAVMRSSCKRRPECKKEDYSANYTDCNSSTFTRTKYYNWTLPHICSTVGESAVTLPDPKFQVPCEKCQPGMIRTEAGECRACSPGHYLPPQAEPQTSQCRRCNSGEEAVEQVYYEYWYRWPQKFKSNGGWVLHEEYTYAGGLANSGRKDSAQLTFRPFFRQDGNLYIKYEAVDVQGFDEQSDKFTVYLDGNLTTILPCSAGHHEATIKIPAGDHEIMWNLAGDNIVKLDRIVATGVDGGGATQCSPCKPGTQSSVDRSSCVACPDGHVSSDGKKCVQCGKNTVPDSDAKTCLPCGSGTVSAKGAIHCTPADKVAFSDQVYNTSVLLESFGNPGPKHKNTSRGVEITLGDRTFTFDVSQISKNLILYEKEITNPLTAYTETKSLYGSETCQIEPGFAYFAGGTELNISQIATQTYDKPNPSKGGGLILELSKGDYCGEDAGSGDYPSEHTGKKRWTTYIEVSCDLDVSDSYSTLHLVSGDHKNSSCPALKFKMDSSFACPVCRKSDFEKSHGDCNSHGKHTIKWVRKIPCIGEQPSYEEDCNQGYSGGIIALLSVGLVLGFSIAVGFGYYLYRLRQRYNDMHSKYVVLRDGYDKNAFNMVPNAQDDIGEVDAKIGAGEGLEDLVMNEDEDVVDEA